MQHQRAIGRRLRHEPDQPAEPRGTRCGCGARGASAGRGSARPRAARAASRPSRTAAASEANRRDRRRSRVQTRTISGAPPRPRAARRHRLAQLLDDEGQAVRQANREGRRGPGHGQDIAQPERDFKARFSCAASLRFAPAAGSLWRAGKGRSHGICQRDRPARSGLWT